MSIDAANALSARIRSMSCFQWLNDPSNIPFVEPYLHKGDAYAADVAVWTLCWLGYGQHIKDYMIGCRFMAERQDG